MAAILTFFNVALRQRTVTRITFLHILAFLLLGWVPCAEALQIQGLKEPQSFIVDHATESYFITNMNGEPDERDNNGFITKLDKAGKIVKLRFIQGGGKSTVLHAPKGMAIVDHVLYVADLDTLRGFDTKTGQPVVSVTMPHQPGDSRGVGLTDVVHVGDGFLYASDTETHTIFRIDTRSDHLVSVLVTDETLAGPRGLALNPNNGRLTVVSWNEGRILEVDGKGNVSVLVSNGFFSSRFTNLVGADYDGWGSLYVSDFTAGKIWRMMSNGKFHVIAEYLHTPANLSVDRQNNLILVPYLYSNVAEINGLETPGKKKRRPRTLKDYGFPFMKPEQKEGSKPDE